MTTWWRSLFLSIALVQGVFSGVEAQPPRCRPLLQNSPQDMSLGQQIALWPIHEMSHRLRLFYLWKTLPLAKKHELARQITEDRQFTLDLLDSQLWAWQDFLESLESPGITERAHFSDIYLWKFTRVRSDNPGINAIIERRISHAIRDLYVSVMIKAAQYGTAGFTKDYLRKRYLSVLVNLLEHPAKYLTELTPQSPTDLIVAKYKDYLQAVYDLISPPKELFFPRWDSIVRILKTTHEQLHHLEMQGFTRLAAIEVELIGSTTSGRNFLPYSDIDFVFYDHDPKMSIWDFSIEIISLQRALKRFIKGLWQQGETGATDISILYARPGEVSILSPVSFSISLKAIKMRIWSLSWLRKQAQFQEYDITEKALHPEP